MKWFGGMIVVIALVGVVGGVMYREKREERSIEIAASPASVWRVLMEFDAYPDWNPMVRRIAGAAEVGATLSVQIDNAGSQMALEPTVLVVKAEREFRWLGRFLMPGLVDGEHYFRLEPSGSGTRFTQGERFRGVLVPVVGSAIEVGDSFERSNAALRDRVLATIAR